MIGSIGWLIIRGIISRRNSRNAAVRDSNIGRIRKLVRNVPATRMPRWASAPATAPHAVATTPKRAENSTVPRTIPVGVQDRGQRVEDEATVRDEDLAERDRRREEDLGEAVDPDQLHVEFAGRGIEIAPDVVAQPRRGQEQHGRGDEHDADGPGEDRPPEVVRILLGALAQAREDRHERGGESGRDQHVEGDLGDAEGGVVGIELGAGAIGVREDAVAHDPHREVREAQDRQDDRSARDEPIEPRQGGRPARQAAHPVAGRHRPMMTDASTVTRRDGRCVR